MMDPEIKLQALDNLIRDCREIPFYRERLPRNPLRSFEEFRSIPLTTKDDVRENSPFGLVGAPLEELYQYHESFGTTGTPVSVWLTREDFQVNAEELAHWGAGFQPTDIVMVRFPYAISAVAHTVTAAAQLRGACVVPAGARSAVSPFPRVVDLLRKLKATILACLPLQALLIAETAVLMGFEPLKDFPDLRAVCTAGETLAPGRRKTLEEIWGVPVFDNYGMTEIGAAVVDCQFQQSHPLEDYFYFEILREDLETPAKTGEKGLLVITTLRRKGTPLIRYLTGDIARLVPEKCACGAADILEVRGRSESLIRIGTRSLDLWEVQEAVSHLPCRRFWVAAPAENGLNLAVEEDKPGDRITPEVIQRLENMLQLKLAITVVPKGTLYDREELLSVGIVGKPQYIYTAAEMAERKYVKSVRV